jgi:hypothetical protein
MSYILAALEKADKERRKKRGLTLDGLSDTGTELKSAPSGYSRMLKVSFGVVACLIIVSLLWRVSPGQLAQMESDAGSLATTSENSPVEVSSMPVTAEAESTTILPARLDVEGIIFIEDQPARSRVFIGGKGYRQGDLYQDDIRVLSIAESALTLSNGTTSKSYPIP